MLAVIVVSSKLKIEQHYSPITGYNAVLFIGELCITIERDNTALPKVFTVGERRLNVPFTPANSAFCQIFCLNLRS
jgi:hypothetical protein